MTTARRKALALSIFTVGYNVSEGTISPSSHHRLLEALRFSVSVSIALLSRFLGR